MTTPTAATGDTAAAPRKVLAARALGRHAALTGAALGSCPYGTDDGEELMLALNWRRGYRAVLPTQTDYGH